jgi:sugar phosphate isomerase/epimerase
MICLFSKHLAKLNYMDLGPVLKQLGFEGCDLTVRPGGHVLPEHAQVDLLRAIEAIRGEGVDVPMITTSLLAASDWTARPVLGIAGTLKVTYYKPGYWRYGPADNIELRVAQVKREFASLVAIGRAYGMVAGFHNHSGPYVGEGIWDTRSIIGDMDPNWAGYYFDPGHATAEGGVAGWNIALRLALPRVKMVALKDFYWAKADGKWKMTMCPMGQGMVDWSGVFSMLAAARFTGPLSLHMEYNPPDELRAISRDLEFVKKQVAAAYGSPT